MSKRKSCHNLLSLDHKWVRNIKSRLLSIFAYNSQPELSNRSIFNNVVIFGLHDGLKLVIASTGCAKMVKKILFTTVFFFVAAIHRDWNYRRWSLFVWNATSYLLTLWSIKFSFQQLYLHMTQASLCFNIVRDKLHRFLRFQNFCGWDSRLIPKVRSDKL